MKEGYGGRAGSHQFDERVVDGITTKDVEKRLARNAELAETVERLADSVVLFCDLPAYVIDDDVQD